ncbi:MAG: hypothetical protein D4R84_09155, partial [Rhodocyclaceae bacterium]
GDGGGTYRVYAPVTLPSGSNFTTKDGSGGATDTYTVITTKLGLVNVAGDLTAKYALGADIDASGADWVPLGNGGGGFTGTLDGLRHAVTKLITSNESATYVGLFGAVDAGGTVKNLGVETDAAGIKGAQFVGVVAGKNAGNISATYSKGLITGSTNGADTVLAIGGLVGQNEGEISETFSSANVVATGGIQTTGMGTDGGIGGLVGVQSGGAPKIYASYATGDVDGLKDVGGLVGYHQVGSIQAVYARGKVNNGTSDPATGGLVGTSNGMQDQIIDGYWDTSTSAQNDGIGTGSPPPFLPGAPLTGYATGDMKKAANFTGGGTYDFNTTGNWVIYEDVTYPLLRTFLTPLIVYADNKSATYDGTAGAGVAFTKTYSIAAPVGGNLAGAVTFGGAAATATNVGDSGTITPNVVQPTSFGTGNSGLAPADKNDQQGYLLVPVNGTLTITAKPVTLTAPAASKPYDGGTSYTATVGELTTLSTALGVTGDTVDTITLVYTGAAAGAGNKTLTPSAATINNGVTNYTITYTASTTATISPKDVTLTPQAATKLFDGNTSYTPLAADLTVLSGQLGVGGETVTGVTLTFDTAAVGTGKTLTPSAAAVSSAAGNYNISYANNTTSSITAAATTTTSTPTSTTRAVETVVLSESDKKEGNDSCKPGGLSGKTCGSETKPGAFITTPTITTTNTGGTEGSYTSPEKGAYMVRVPSTDSKAVLTARDLISGTATQSNGRIQFTLPDDTFTHTRTNAVVQLSATQANGQPLPNWMSFDSQTGKISGTPPAGVRGEISIRVKARDNFGNEAATTLKLNLG